MTKYVIYFSAIKVPCITYCTRKMNLIDDNDGDDQWCEVKCVIKSMKMTDNILSREDDDVRKGTTQM